MDNFIILLIIICILISIIYCSVLFCSLSISIIHCSDDDNCSDLKGLFGDGESSEYWGWGGGGQEGQEGQEGDLEQCSDPTGELYGTPRSIEIESCYVAVRGSGDDNINRCGRNCVGCFSRSGYICANNPQASAYRPCVNGERCLKP